MNKRLLLGIPLILLVFSMTFIQFADAVTWYYTTGIMDTLYGDFWKWNTEAQTVEHRTGRFILAYYSETGAGFLNVTQWSESGVKEASAVSAENRDAVGDDRTFIKIVDHNTTMCFIFITDTDIGDDYYVHLYSWNVVSFNLVKEDTLTLETNHEYNTASHIASVYYGGDPYFIFYSVGFTTGAYERIRAIQFDVSSNTLVETVDQAVDGITGASWTVQPHIIQHPNATNEVYFVTSHEPDGTLPKFWKIDLFTGVGELLATGGSVNRLTIQWNQHYVDSGIYISSDDTYLWWTWLRPYVTGTDRYVTMVQHRLRFNVTVEAGQLEAQNERVSIIAPTLPAGTDECWAVPTESNRTHFTVYTPIQTGGQYTGFYWDMEVTDWTNFGISTLTPIDSGTENDTIPFITHEDVIYRDPESNFQLNVEPSGAPDEIYLFYDVEPTDYEYDYDIDLSWVPNDDPLDAVTSYQFTVAVTEHDIEEACAVQVIIDGIDYGTRNTDSNGILRFNYNNWAGGVVRFYIVLYDPLNVGGEYFDLTFTTAELDPEGDPDVLIPVTIGAMMGALPVMILFFVPTVSLYTMLGSAGVIFGTVIFLAFGIWTGYVPAYIVFLVGLCVIGYFVYRTR